MANREQPIDCIKDTRYTAPTLLLVMDNTNTLYWYVDDVFGVHHDMKSHTGIMMAMNQGASRSNSTKQKLNKKSSTEADLVGIDDEIVLIICYGYLLAERGYQVRDIICC